MLGLVDNIHGNELGAEGQHIQVRSKGLVGLKHLNGQRDKGAQTEQLSLNVQLLYTHTTYKVHSIQ